MNSSMQSAEWVGMMTTITGIAIVAFILLILFVATAPVRATASVAPWADGELGTAAAYREPADLDEVDQRIKFYRARATAPVIYSPAPLDELMSASTRYVIPPELDLRPAPTSRYAMPIAELVASARYVLPSPVSPARHVESVGRHRAPVLVAA